MNTQGKICEAVSEKSENFYLVHSSPVSFIQDELPCCILHNNRANTSLIAKLILYTVCTASDKQNSRTFQGVGDRS